MAFIGSVREQLDLVVFRHCDGEDGAGKFGVRNKGVAVNRLTAGVMSVALLGSLLQVCGSFFRSQFVYFLAEIEFLTLQRFSLRGYFSD